MTVSYMVARATQIKGWRRFFAIFTACVAAYLGAISTSTTFVIGMALLAAMSLLSFVASFLLQRRLLGPGAAILVCLTVILSIWLAPLIWTYFEATINAKGGDVFFRCAI